MREFTKSMVSFSWSMPLFGLQQMMNVLTPTQPGRQRHKAAEAFDNVAGVAEEQLGDTLRGLFQSGDKLQRGMVDLTFNMLTLQMFNPRGMTGMSPGGMQQPAGCCRASGPRDRDGGQKESTGWGPVSTPGTA